MIDGPQPPAPHAQLSSPAGEGCPGCGAGMAPDQRYCLECGARRGDPRLPFMDAAAFMDAGKRPREQTPPAPKERESRSRMTANASLIAGVATLVLAIGVGVMIGRSGDGNATPVAASAPQIIRVGTGGGEEAAAAAEVAAGGANDGGKSGKAKKAKAPEKSVDDSGTSEAAAEVLKPAGDVKLPPPTVKPGGECESGAAGCEGGEFTGDFFGE